MSENREDEISYQEVPGRAMMNYRKAFARHDEERFLAFMGKALDGEAKIHSAKVVELKGETLAHVVFWNVNSQNDVFHADKNRKGVQLCSGQSVTVFRQLISCIGLTPMEMMNHVIGSERYACITC